VFNEQEFRNLCRQSSAVTEIEYTTLCSVRTPVRSRKNCLAIKTEISMQHQFCKQGTAQAYETRKQG
jgi:hypothetical protein